MNYFEEGERLKGVFESLIRQHKRTKKRVVESREMDSDALKRHEEVRVEIMRFFEENHSFIRPRKNSFGVFSVEDFVKFRSRESYLPMPGGGFESRMHVDRGDMYRRNTVSGILPFHGESRPWSRPFGESEYEERNKLGFREEYEARRREPVFGEGYGELYNPNDDLNMFLGPGIDMSRRNESVDSYGDRTGFPGSRMPMYREQEGFRPDDAYHDFQRRRMGYSPPMARQDFSSGFQFVSNMGMGHPEAEWYPRMNASVFQGSPGMQPGFRKQSSFSPQTLEMHLGHGAPHSLARNIPPASTFVPSPAAYSAKGNQLFNVLNEAHPSRSFLYGTIQPKEKARRPRLQRPVQNMYRADMASVLKMEVPGTAGRGDMDQADLWKEMEESVNSLPLRKKDEEKHESVEKERTLEDVIEIVGSHEPIDGETRDFVYELCDSFLEHVMHMSCALAYHRNKSAVEKSDIRLALKTEADLELHDDLIHGSLKNDTDEHVKRLRIIDKDSRRY